MSTEAFWQTTPLEELSREQWESLCDGCARCCLNKLEDIDTTAILYTNVACALLNEETCQCTHYEERRQHVPDCLVLKPEDLKPETMRWFPSTCAYRLLAEGKDLPDWHPLISGDRNSTIAAGIAVKGRIISEKNVAEDDLQDHVIEWVEY